MFMEALIAALGLRGSRYNAPILLAEPQGIVRHAVGDRDGLTRLQGMWLFAVDYRLVLPLGSALPLLVREDEPAKPGGLVRHAPPPTSHPTALTCTPRGSP